MRLLKLTTALCLFISPIFWANQVQAQDCGCDHTITGNNDVLNVIQASDFTYQAGDVFCITAGTYSAFRFEDFQGAEGNPLIFKNCGGEVIMNSPTYSAIQFKNSKYIHLTGTGSNESEYGIKVEFTKSGTSGVAVADLSSDFEIDHIDIANTGFAGIICKTDPKCEDPNTWRENFLMENIIIHDNFIHETEGEGMYIGGTFGYETSSRECEGVDTFAHLIHGVRIYDNRIENAGWDGFQISLCEQDVKVYDNVIMNYGTRLEGNQNYGLALGAGTRAQVYNNLITQIDDYHTPLQRGISIIDPLTGSIWYNNVIINSGGDGIWMHVRMSNASLGDLGQGFYFINNTIVEPAGSGIFYNTSIPGGGGPRGDLLNAFHNNLIIDPGNNYENSGFWKTADEAFIDFNEREQRDQSTKSSNMFSRDLASINFADPANDNYAILETSPAVDAGMDVSSFGVTFDFNSGARPVGSAYDIGAYEFGASNQIPIVDIGGDISSNVGEEILLAATASDPDGEVSAYLWEIVGADAAAYTLTDENTASASLVFNETGDYSIRLTVTDNEDAKAIAEISATIAGSLGLFDRKDNREAELISTVYPNPTTGKLHIGLQDIIDNTRIEFYDLNGSLLYAVSDLGSLDQNGSEFIVDISPVINEAGLYLMLVRQGDLIDSKRISIR